MGIRSLDKITASLITLRAYKCPRSFKSLKLQSQVIFFSVFPKKLSTKANALSINFSRKPRRLKRSSLKLNYWDLKLTEKLLFYFHMWSYCFNQAGKYLWYLLPPLARPGNALDNVICVHGSRWQQAQNMVVGIDATMWFGFPPLWENCTSGILQNFQKVLLNWLLTNKFPENRQFQMSGH